MKTRSFWPVMILLMLLAIPARGQTPTQIKQVIPGTPNVTFNWGYNVTDETSIDLFALQWTAWSTTVIITNPYPNELTSIQKAARTAIYPLPTPAPTSGQKAFYRMVARKIGLADSVPSNVVQIEVVPTPPSPTGLSIAGITHFTEVEYTKKQLGPYTLWCITNLL